MKAGNLDEKFDSGEEIMEHLDLEKAKRPILEQRRINVDLPIWMVDSLDRESTRLGVTRQSVIKVWLDEKLRDLDEG